MKRLVVLFGFLGLLVIPSLSAAQNPGYPKGFDPSKMMERFGDPAAMQKMAEEAQAMQTCMESVDEAKLRALQREAEAMADEIEKLCDAGKKDQALNKAMSMARKMNADPTIKKVRECSKGMTDMMKDMPFGQIDTFDEDEKPTSDDICS